MDFKILERKLSDLENERIALQHCEKIVKNILHKENEKVNNEKYIHITEGLIIEKTILCIVINHLTNIFENNSIIIETVNKDDKECTFITIQ